MLAPKCATYNGRSTFANPKYLKIAQSEKPRLYEIPYDTSDPANRFCPNGEETVTLEKESRSKLDKDKVKPYDYTYQNSLYETFKPPSKTYLDQLERAKEVRKTMWRKTHCFVHELKKEMHDDLEYVKSLEKEIDELESEKADFSNIYDLLLEEVIHTTSVSRPQLKCYQVKDKVVPNNSHVKFQKKEVEDHHRIFSISKKTKSVTAYLNARTKKPNVVPISASKHKRKENKSIATPHKKTVASDTTIQKSKSYYKKLYENTNQEWRWWIAKRCPSALQVTQSSLRTKNMDPKVRKDDEFNNDRHFSCFQQTGKIFTSITTKVDSEPLNGSKEDITNQCESEQALDVSAGTLLSTADQALVFMAMTFEQRSSSLVLYQMTSDHNCSELEIQDHSNEQSSSKLVPKVVP
ncbi:hypothetical protein Tco_0866827 [Tanacetum coccineum]